MILLRPNTNNGDHFTNELREGVSKVDEQGANEKLLDSSSASSKTRCAIMNSPRQENRKQVVEALTPKPDRRSDRRRSRSKAEISSRHRSPHRGRTSGGRRPSTKSPKRRSSETKPSASSNIWRQLSDYDDERSRNEAKGNNRQSGDSSFLQDSPTVSSTSTGGTSRQQEETVHRRRRSSAPRHLTPPPPPMRSPSASPNLSSRGSDTKRRRSTSRSPKRVDSSRQTRRSDRKSLTKQSSKEAGTNGLLGGGLSKTSHEPRRRSGRSEQAPGKDRRRRSNSSKRRSSHTDGGTPRAAPSSRSLDVVGSSSSSSRKDSESRKGSGARRCKKSVSAVDLQSWKEEETGLNKGKDSRGAMSTVDLKGMIMESQKPQVDHLRAQLRQNRGERTGREDGKDVQEIHMEAYYGVTPDEYGYYYDEDDAEHISIIISADESEGNDHVVKTSNRRSESLGIRSSSCLAAATYHHPIGAAHRNGAFKEVAAARRWISHSHGGHNENDDSSSSCSSTEDSFACTDDDSDDDHGFEVVASGSSATDTKSKFASFLASAHQTGAGSPLTKSSSNALDDQWLYRQKRTPMMSNARLSTDSLRYTTHGRTDFSTAPITPNRRPQRRASLTMLPPSDPCPPTDAAARSPAVSGLPTRRSGQQSLSGFSEKPSGLLATTNTPLASRPKRRASLTIVSADSPSLRPVYPMHVCDAVGAPPAPGDGSTPPRARLQRRGSLTMMPSQSQHQTSGISAGGQSSSSRAEGIFVATPRQSRSPCRRNSIGSCLMSEGIEASVAPTTRIRTEGAGVERSNDGDVDRLSSKRTSKQGNHGKRTLKSGSRRTSADDVIIHKEMR